MPYSKYKQKKVTELKQKVFDLYKQGYTLREVQDIIKSERSYTWISNAAKELEELENKGAEPLIHNSSVDKV